MGVKYTNNAETTLASAISSTSATSVTVASSSPFPSLSGSDYFYATLELADASAREVVKVTAVSGTTWTVVRGQDDTTARTFAIGDKVELRLNAALLTDVVNDAMSDAFTRQAFTGDGSETDFTLSKAPASENDLIVFIEGAFQTQSAYSVSGTTLTFSAAPADTREIIVYSITAAVNGDSLSQNNFTSNGNSGSGGTVYTLSVDPLHENNTMVFLDGVYQNKSTYTVSGTTLTLDAAPTSGVVVECITHTQTEVNTPATNSVVTASIVDANVTTAKIADDAVTAAKLASSAVVTASIVDDNITQAKIADDAVGPDQLASSSVVTASVVDDAITTAKIADDQITAAKIADNSITNALMADDAIDSAEIANGAIDLAHMSVNSIDSDQYVDGSIDTAHLADDQITLAKMAGLARGKIIYGDASGNPAALSPGSNGQVLKSDGTDISWGTDATVAALTSEEVQDITGAQIVTNGSHTGITASYDDAGDGAIDLVVGTLNQNTTGTAANLSGTPNISVGTIGSGNITTTGYLAGPASFTIDPATVGDNTGTVVIAGSLQVDGTTTTINSTTVSIDDLNFSIATDAADSAAANGAGITIGGASATMLYTHATTSFDFNKPVNITGTLSASGNITGTLATAAQPAITSLGTLTTLTVDDITINGSTISDGGDLTIDAAGDIILDADTGDIHIQDGGTETLRYSSSGDGPQFYSPVSDKDLIFKGNDGGSTVTALTLDMSDAGAATFNSSFNNGSVNHIANQIQSGYGDNSDNSDIWINYTGYQGGTTYFRDFRVGNGKQSQLLVVDGSAGTVAVTNALTAGSLTVGNSNIGSNTSHLANLTINNNAYIGSAGNTTAIKIATSGAVTMGYADLTITADNARLLVEEADGTNIAWVGDHTGDGHGGLLLYNHGGTATVKLTADSHANYINNGNNFGIGTATPIKTLDIKAPDSTTKQLLLQQDNTDDGWSFYADRADGHLKFYRYDSGTETNAFQVRCTSAAASTMLRLDNGADGHDVGIELYQNGSRKWEIVNDDSESDPLDIRTSGGAGGSGLRIAQNGKVGIAVGNIAPAEMLHMIAASGDCNLRMEGSTVRIKKSGSDWLSYDGSNLKLSTGNTERMRITGDGKIGIGCTAPPHQKLTITGTSASADGQLANGILALTTGTGVLADTKLLFGIVDDDYAWIQPADYGVAYRDLALNPNGGNVGCGTTTPQGTLDVNGTSYFQNTVHMQGAANLQFIGGVYPTFIESGNDLILKRADTGVTMYTFAARTGNTAVTSDERLKENIETITGATDKVKQLRGVTHTWKEAMQHPDDPEAVNLGLIAQEVETVVPEVVHTPQVTEQTPIAYKSISYDKLVPLLIETIKELEARIKTLEDA